MSVNFSTFAGESDLRYQNYRRLGVCATKIIENYRKLTKIIGNYIRDDTAIQNNKNYLNQQHQQLARQSTPCRAQGISCKCQQVYKSQN